LKERRFFLQDRFQWANLEPEKSGLKVFKIFGQWITALDDFSGGFSRI